MKSVGDGPLYGANFVQALVRFYRNYARFTGRSSRSEYWWVQLFLSIAAIVAATIFVSSGAALEGYPKTQDELQRISATVEPLLWVVMLLVVTNVVPYFALTFRRLHDSGHSGWWSMLLFAPYFGQFVPVVIGLLGSVPEQETKVQRVPVRPSGE